MGLGFCEIFPLRAEAALRGQRQVSTCTDLLKRFAPCYAPHETLQ